MSGIDSAEMRRRWSNQTNADFSGVTKVSQIYQPEAFERECDFSDCEDIIFWNGQGLETRGDQYIMSVKPSGHASLPAGVRVQVVNGKVKFNSPSGGVRAPPPSRVSDYASPPRDAAAFMRGGPEASSYMSAANIPPPRSNAGYREQIRDDCSIAPSESISSVGSRGQVPRRVTDGF
ncbi:hypothetical protein B0I37DRAFT_414784 [Chaetomium sp. MPI-CAGE-AT-0009]|nr:hypothetical protein B0I37DRAFT_414784 [Chaetomium sp. MPI-CAGE-AT-0009]